MKKYNSNILFFVYLIFISLQFSCQHSGENSSVTVDSSVKIDSLKKVDSKNLTIAQKPDNWVNDNENIFDESSFNLLVKLISDFRDKTAVEIGVVTTPTYAPFDSITAYSIALGNQWGIGQKEINNGVLIVVSTNQRQVRITTGLGMETLLPDDKCQQVVNEKMLPSFKQGNYPEGIINGVKEIIRLLEAQMHEVKF